jgi:cysteinyl-tRNA synthetase
MMRAIAFASALLLLVASVSTVTSAQQRKGPDDGGAVRRSETERRARIAPVKSWGYWLRRIDISQLAASPYDLMVVDYARTRSQFVEHAFTSAEVDAMRTRPDGTKRLVISYVSIGEAEWYRYYWRPEWEGDKLPRWIGPMNPAWYGNFPVRFWDADWQRILFEPGSGYLDRILSAGFDGLYLDRVDVYEEFLKEWPSARSDMIAFLEKLRREVDRRRPGTLIIQQNAEELLADRRAIRAIDAIAKENLIYGLTEQHTLNAQSDIAWSAKHLQRARKSGRPVMVVEYLDRPEVAADARRRIERNGFLATFAPRLLHALPLVPVDRQSEPVVWPPKPQAYGPLHAPRPDNY